MTGPLSTFPEVAPLLLTAPSDDGLVMSFRCNGLLNCSLLKSYDSYLHSTVALARGEVVRIIGLDTDTKIPSVCSTFVSWTQMGKPTIVPLSHAE
jgi:hypothetical protein